MAGYVETEEGGGLKRHIMRSGFTLLARQILTIVLKFGGVLIITRILGPQEYAAYVVAFSIYSFVLGIGQAGVGVYMLRHAGEIDERAIGTATTFLALQSISLVIILEAAAGFIESYTTVPSSALATRIIILALPLQTLQAPALSRIERSFDLKGVAIVELFTQTCYYALALALALSHFGAISLCLALIGQYAIAVVLTYRIARAPIVFAWDRTILIEIVRYMISFNAANYAFQMRSLVNPFVIGPALGSTAVGVVGMAISVLEVLTFIRSMIWRIIVAGLGRFRNDAAKLRRIIEEGMELQVLAVGALLLGFGWFGPWVVPIVFGARWMPLFQVYPYIALSYLTIAMFNMHSALLSTLNRNWWLAIYQTLNVFCLAAGTAESVHWLGITGSGVGELATLFSYIGAHYFETRLIGSPNYRLALLWWSAAALGLFWRQLGIWTVVVPFLTLLLPVSRRRLHATLALVINRRRMSAGSGTTA